MISGPFQRLRLYLGATEVLNMTILNIISLLTGIALFLFGMSMMGGGLKQMAGRKLENLLARLTNTTWKGILLGAGATAVIQSSSATSIMAVSFADSGMLRFRRAIGVVLGAILGTSVTGWLLCLSQMETGSEWLSLLSAETLTGFAAVAGVLLRTSGRKKPALRHLGDILLGFAVLMTGMSMMSEAVSPLRESEAFLTFLTAFSNPLTGILAGIVCAAVLQSASAAVGVLQALTLTGAIDFSVALPLLLGFSIGASVPVLISAAGANTEGKRTAFSYLAISFLGTVLCGGIYYSLDGLLGFSFSSTVMDASAVALVNTVFRLSNVLLLWPFAELIERGVSSLIRGEKGVKTTAGAPAVGGCRMISLPQSQESANAKVRTEQLAG